MMGGGQHSIFYALLMIIAGLGIPLMATLNGGLGARISNPTLATTLFFGVAFLASFAFLLASQGIPEFNFSKGIPKFYYFGGFFVVFYLLSVTWVASKFGIASAIAFVLLGQLISMTAIDHFALFGALSYPITLKRFLGLLIMALGIFLVVKHQ